MKCFFAVNLMAIGNGVILGWTSPMIPYFLSNETHIVMTRREAELLEVFLLLGEASGLPLTSFLVGRIGRKYSLIFASCVIILTWIVLAAVNKVDYVYAARYFQGIALHMAFVIIPMFVGEISDKKIRGLLSSMSYVMISLGVVIIYTVGPLLPYYVHIIIAVVPLILEIILFQFIPESPYFLVAKGRIEEAAKSLREFRKCFYVDSELSDIKNTIQNEVKDKIRIMDFFCKKNYRRAFLIMIILNSSQLFCGFEVILMNLHDILVAGGTVYVSATTVGIIYSSVQLSSCIISSLLVDKFGRKNLLIVSSFLTGICLVTVAVYFHLQYSGLDTLDYSWIPIATLMTYGAVFKIGLGLVPIVMSSELFAPKIKSFGMVFADGVYIFSAVICLQVFFYLRDCFGLHVPFYLFSLYSFLTLGNVLYFVPETKGKSLEEIQDILKI